MQNTGFIPFQMQQMQSFAFIPGFGYCVYVNPMQAFPEQFVKGISAPNSLSEESQNLRQLPTTNDIEENDDLLLAKCPLSKKIKKTSLIECEGESSQFDPRKSKTQTPTKKPKGKQNQNRNVIPNIVHQAFSYIMKKKKSEVLLAKIIKYLEMPEGATLNRFYTYQKKIKEKMNHYLCEDSLSILNTLAEPDCKIYSLSEQNYYLKISRILIVEFLRTFCPAVTLTSKRMSKDKRFEHLKARRHLLERLSALLL